MNLVLAEAAKNSSNVMEDYRNRDSIHVAVGVIFNSDNQVLVAFRSEDVDQGGLWEFPGGKVEPDEDSLQALCRELKEEVGIEVIKAEPFLQSLHDYKNYHVTLHTYVVSKFSGKPKGLLGQPLQWIDISELSRLKFPDANRIIIDELSSSYTTTV